MATGSEQPYLRDALPVGTELGTYQIESVLGHGGFGIVYRARHLELDSVVAIKELLPLDLAVRDGCAVHPRSTDCVEAFDEARVRFLDEARSLVQFRSHPGVITCLEFFRAHGTAYMVMEYERGTTLSELLKQREADGRPFGQADLLRIAGPLLEALSAVHEAGQLHRDIKPSNILVRRRDGKPILIDFGAAKQTAATHSKSFAPATEGYAAPEQVGEGELGTWTDLYAIGAVFWRMVAGGNPPWNPPNPIKVESRLNAMVRGSADPLPTARTLGSGRFSEALLHAIDKCLKLPEPARVQNCIHLMNLLQVSHDDKPSPGHGGAHGEPSRETRAASGQHPRAFRGRVRPLLIVLASASVAILLAFGGSIQAHLHYSLARQYDQGHFVQQDLPAAAWHYESAANLGHTNAQFNLGNMYCAGDGVRRDRNQCEDWYRSAAEKGHVSARYNLYLMLLFSESRGEESRYGEAEQWRELLLQSRRGRSLVEHGSYRPIPRL